MSLIQITSKPRRGSINPALLQTNSAVYVRASLGYDLQEAGLSDNNPALIQLGHEMIRKSAQEIKKSRCPDYHYEKPAGEQWNFLCTSGAEGKFHREQALCISCVFFAIDYHPGFAQRLPLADEPHDVL
jgi:hypothetical protein